ncbi:MAG: hypothetical protein ACHP9T_11685, partial [Caulobacterales bacterium]
EPRAYCPCPYAAGDLGLGVVMKTSVSFRIDSALLESAKRAAKTENRTLTNFLETLLREKLVGQDVEREPVAPSAEVARV